MLIKDPFNFFKSFRKKKTQCKSQERILGLLDARELHVWIGRGDIMSHLLGVQETNS